MERREPGMEWLHLLKALFWRIFGKDKDYGIQ
jgi:hypothetical protein